jgi:hypothetical protein
MDDYVSHIYNKVHCKQQSRSVSSGDICLGKNDSLLMDKLIIGKFNRLFVEGLCNCFKK